MKLSKINIGLLNRIYYISTTFLLVLIIFTPLLVREGLTFIEEEVFELLIIAAALFLVFLINQLYQRELKKREKTLEGAWKHVGELNLQIERFRSAIVDFRKYPENKSDLKFLFKFTAEKILGILNIPCLMFRIVEEKSMRTLSEYFQERMQGQGTDIKIENSCLIGNMSKKGYQIIASSPKNYTIRVFCIFPKTFMTEDQKLFTQKTVDDLCSYYIIFSSAYYRGTGNNKGNHNNGKGR